MADEIDDLVDWQLENVRQQPTSVWILGRADGQTRCPYCKYDWHGLPKAGCKGSFNGDTPTTPPSLPQAER